MTKIKKISVKNFKALSEQEIDLNGCSAIITAGNNKGKSSLLSGLIDRFRGEKPEIILKSGEDKGSNVMELTDGSVIEWKFTDKSEGFTFTTKDDIKQTTSVLTTIGKRYFGNKFDIDDFIKSSKKEQVLKVQKLVGLDLSEIDAKYKKTYEERTEAGRELNRIASLKLEKPVEVNEPNIESIKSKKDKIVRANLDLKILWEATNKSNYDSVSVFNKKQSLIQANNDIILEKQADLLKLKDSVVADFIDFEGLEVFVSKMPIPSEMKVYKLAEEPAYVDVKEIDDKLEQAYKDLGLYNEYTTSLKTYNDWVADGTLARAEYERLESEIQKINAERFDKVSQSNIPKDFELTEEGVLYNGLPLDSNQISSSAKYISALKLGYLVLGEIRAMHFDASYLDKVSLKEIQDWAESNDLQLLIERPDFEAGEIRYEIISD